jgi:predicted MFS family arabinose efflux permease
MVCSILGSLGGVLSSRLVKHHGAMSTMLITHIPASLTIILIPLMPTKSLTIFMMILRFSMGNMNISARQTFVATMVRPDERSAANGVSNIARSFGLCFSPIILGVLMVRPAHSLGFAMPFHIAGTVKLGYDFLIWVFYRRLRREGVIGGQEVRYACVSGGTVEDGI